ncbi:uncharacterized protein ARMOST_09806 [Armillaria ostoyae]|uniref:Uncharacterized protein n=1 Tax=Armillaria ostoyae TaxID=47428 RepID=A0A284RCJ2_ARMOS|nr:uncharacterized protein ARMOST_09806 [Armillaria ostoyae]
MTPSSSASTMVVAHAHNGGFYCRGRVKRMATIDLLDEVSPSMIIDTYARPDGGLDSARRDLITVGLVPANAPTLARGFSLFLGLRKALTFEPSLRLTGSCIGEPCSNVATSLCHGGYGPGSQNWDGAGMMGERRLTLSPGVAPDKTRGKWQVYSAAALETSTPSAHGGSIRGVSTKIDGYADKVFDQWAWFCNGYGW